MGKSAEPSFLAQEPTKSSTESPKPASSGGGVFIIIFISFYLILFLIIYFLYFFLMIYFLCMYISFGELYAE